MEFLYFLEDLRFPALNELMLLITHLGEETAFLVAAMIVFWCVDKRKGYYLLSVGFIGTMIGQFLKLTFRVPRPWVIDPNFSILEQAREAAAGFSFPSGHSICAVGTFGSIASFTEKKIRTVCILICILVPFSRMYIGVHTPADVLTGSLLALLLVFTLRPMCWKTSDTGIKDILTMMLSLALTLLLFVRFYPFEIDPSQIHNLESGSKNAYTMLGATGGLMIVYPLEKKYLNFETKAVWWAQMLKVILGLILVLAVKEGLRSPLNALFGGHLAARSVRYCLIVLAAGLIWPMTFRWFAKLGVKNELR